MTLAACCLWLAAWLVKAWSLKLVAIDHYPGTKALPVIAHDLEFSCDGQQLAWSRVTNFYCEFFTHQAFSISCILITAS